jgi:hypothetical protein
MQLQPLPLQQNAMVNPHKKKNPVPPPPHPAVAALQNPHDAKWPFQTAIMPCNPCAKPPSPPIVHILHPNKNPAIRMIVRSSRRAVTSSPKVTFSSQSVDHSSFQTQAETSQSLWLSPVDFIPFKHPSDDVDSSDAIPSATSKPPASSLPPHSDCIQQNAKLMLKAKPSQAAKVKLLLSPIVIFVLPSSWTDHAASLETLCALDSIDFNNVSATQL